MTPRQVSRINIGWRRKYKKKE